jgi:NADH-quinone oxidoreductase subunit G
MSEELVTIEVDGRELQAKAGTMLIDVTDQAGIAIPRFCYHKKLSVSANCRMCLVEVEKVPRPLPACATPVTAGMKVRTRSPLAVQAQKGTMEFLLINHPLDCPICDQGGECELQDLAMGYGSDVSRYVEGKRVCFDHDLGPLIATDFTRCIQCTRCVRFGAEIAGIRELGATGRGEHMHIGTYVDKSVDSELSGNVIDLCPVGALTSKPFRFQARAWELVQRDGIAGHDSVGSNLHFHLRGNRILRVHPKENEAINECWISDRDRFSYEGLYAPDRLTRPLLKEGDVWREANWDEALLAAARGLKQAAEHSGDALAALVAPTATLEEIHLTRKLFQGLGSTQVEHRLRQTDLRAPQPRAPWLGCRIAELEASDAVLLIGANPRKEQPLLGHRLRKAALDGARITSIYPRELEFNHSAEQWVTTPAGMVRELAGLAKALGSRKGVTNKAKAEERHKGLAAQLKEAKGARILLGNLAVAHPDYALLLSLAAYVAQHTGATLGILPAASNSVGAGMLAATTTAPILEAPRRAYLLIGLEPGNDLWNPAQGMAALAAADTVVALTAYRSPSLEQTAKVMLPIATFAETSGTFVNAEGGRQSFAGVALPPGEARPAWKVLRVLANLAGVPGFDYTASSEVLAEVELALGEARPDNGLEPDLGLEPRQGEDALCRLGEVPIYAVDPIVRRAPALQRSADAVSLGLRISAATARGLGVEAGAPLRVSQGGPGVTLEVMIDDRIPAGTVWVPAAVPGSEALGGQIGDVVLEKA